MKNKKFLAGEEAGTYIVPEQVTEADILDMALKLARGRLSKGRKIEQPSSAFSYLQTLMHEYEHEVFGVLFLDTKHRVIRFEELFKGTLDAASVYPREVTKRALELNAAAVILVHNHPDGLPAPSEQDLNLTEKIEFLANELDVCLIDHLIVTRVQAYSLKTGKLL